MFETVGLDSWIHLSSVESRSRNFLYDGRLQAHVNLKMYKLLLAIKFMTKTAIFICKLNILFASKRRSVDYFI
ncbi:hypothetical protein, partial [Acinetobacter sp. Res13-Abat-PEC15-P5-02]